MSGADIRSTDVKTTVHSSEPVIASVQIRESDAHGITPIGEVGFAVVRIIAYNFLFVKYEFPCRPIFAFCHKSYRNYRLYFAESHKKFPENRKRPDTAVLLPAFPYNWRFHTCNAGN